MKCPHCLVVIHPEPLFVDLGADADGHWVVKKTYCPNCKRFILKLINQVFGKNGIKEEDLLFRPRSISRTPPPQEVPEHIKADYIEACLVLFDSPKASAALSRRCLQNLLLDAAGVKKGDLSNQIQAVIDSAKLPSHLSDDIDAIRNIGNFAAHPNKSLSTGEILEVETHEAEWNLEVLESLFDFYYVQPAKAKLRRDLLNAKLNDSGKPNMKS